MALKRNSRIFVEDCARADEMQQRTAPSAPSAPYRSRRNSRSSTKDDKLLGALDLEDVSRNAITIRETSTVIRSQSGIIMSKELSVAATTVSRGDKNSEQTVEHVPRSASLPSRTTADWSSDFASVPLIGRPANFGVVTPGLYRSSYPKPDDYGFLKDLNLKTVVTLVKKDEKDEELDTFLSGNGIRHIVFGMKGTKKETIAPEMMDSILAAVLDQQNYPLLLHCNHGKHRTGCVVAAMRKMSGWNLQRTLDEYELYAAPKLRDCDVQYISTFQATSIHFAHAEMPSRLSSRVEPRTFLRTLAFSTFVLFLWLLSGSRIVGSREQ
jgi:tyrosine-protein phosphatase SIW14